MVNPNDLDFAAFPPTYREEDGEIVPNLTGVNANKYNHPKEDIPCDIGSVTLSDTEVPADVKAAIERFKYDHPNKPGNSAHGATARYIQGRKDILG